MKKRKWLIRILIIIIMIFTTLLFLPKILSLAGFPCIVGRYLAADNGSHILVHNYYTYDNRFTSDIVEPKNNNMFKNITSGDKILLITRGGARNEVYPGYSYAYFCIKLSDGDIDDVPFKELQSLIQLGYTELEISQTATLSNDEIHMSIDLPKKWDYTLLPDNQGISIYPEGVTAGSVELLFYPDGFPQESVKDFQSEPGRLFFGGYEITKYYFFDLDYDSTLDFYDLGSWDYIHFSEPYENYVIYNNGAEVWSDEQNLEFQNILATIKFK